MCSSLVIKYHSDTVRVILTPQHAKNENNITIIIYNMQELLYLIKNGCNLAWGNNLIDVMQLVGQSIITFEFVLREIVVTSSTYKDHRL